MPALGLALLVTGAVAAVIATTSYLDVRTFEETVEADRLQAAAATAQAVADDVELRDGLNQPAETLALLHDFLAVTPPLRDIAVLRKQGEGFTLVGRTLSGSVGMEDVEAAAREAVGRRELTWVGAGRERRVAVPVVRQGQVAGAVAVTVSLAQLEEVGARGRQVMKNEAHDDPSALDRLQIVETQIRKVPDAIHTILDSARRPVPQRQPVDAAALVEQVCEVSRPALRAADVDVRLEIQRPLPALSADPVQLELALFHLVCPARRSASARRGSPRPASSDDPPGRTPHRESAG